MAPTRWDRSGALPVPRASLNYFALDRLDIMYVVKGLMQNLSRLNMGDWQKLKRVARYLITTPRLVMRYP